MQSRVVHWPALSHWWRSSAGPLYQWWLVIPCTIFVRRQLHSNWICSHLKHLRPIIFFFVVFWKSTATPGIVRCRQRCRVACCLFHTWSRWQWSSRSIWKRELSIIVMWSPTILTLIPCIVMHNTVVDLPICQARVRNTLRQIRPSLIHTRSSSIAKARPRSIKVRSWAVHARSRLLLEVGPRWSHALSHLTASSFAWERGKRIICVARLRRKRVIHWPS